MADQEDDDFQLAIRMSMQSSPKRSKPGDLDAAAAVTPEDTKRLQREIMAAAAEKRMMAARPSPPSKSVGSRSSGKGLVGGGGGERDATGKCLTVEEAEQLFCMVFGSGVSKSILAQWTNQGIRFSNDPETAMGLVQHEGGPCGVLATIQAFVLKHLLFSPGELGKNALHKASKSLDKGLHVASCNISYVPDDVKVRALVKSMGDILFLCGNGKRAAIATLNAIEQDTDGLTEDNAITKALESVSIESSSDLHKILRVHTYTSEATALQKLEQMIPVFQSRMGALLFLISALLSRELKICIKTKQIKDMVQSDRDDPSLPLVTAPFGHASQEIVNLLLCGQAVPNVFDGRMDLGGGMSLKGISTNVEVGFLTLLESLNFCKVGQHLKYPRWPIWVVGSESHYTVLFALDNSVQEENELEERESEIRRAFDSQDQSGGGGFIAVDGFHQVLRETNIRLSSEKTDSLCSNGFIVWSEFWQVILDLDESLGGLKDSSGLMGKKMFDLYHFNGIAKSDLNGCQINCGGETPTQRPRLTKLRVSVPPRWSPEEYMAVVVSSSLDGNGSTDKEPEVNKPEPPQRAPLVDCIRTRWPRAVCNWVGDSPSIV